MTRRSTPLEFKEKHSEIPWHRIVGLRHRIVHDYFDVDMDLVWAIVETELPTLAAQISSIQISETDLGPENKTRDQGEDL